jgi:hypothetical protein
MPCQEENHSFAEKFIGMKMLPEPGNNPLRVGFHLRRFFQMRFDTMH